MPPSRPLPIPLPLAPPLSWLYLQAMRADRAIKRRRAQRLTIPVISVGNLSVGGTGKSPMVLRIAQWLADARRHPCIAMRGYTPAPAHDASDEADAYRRSFLRLGLEVRVVAQPDRATGVRALLAAHPQIDCVILDDGFQHHRLARDLDIVLIDATRSPFEDRLLPAGWLREPITALRRASAVVITHAQSIPPDTLAELARKVKSATDRPPLAVTRHMWKSLDTGWDEWPPPPSPRGSARGEGRGEGLPRLLEPSSAPDHAPVSLPLSWLRNKRVLALCAIGNPDPFLRAAREAIGADPVATITLRDHDPYDAPTVDRILNAARNAAASAALDAILTTDKDWSKLARLDPSIWPCPLVRPRLEIEFDAGEDALRTLALEAAARGVAPPR